jgi:hypothetical protein
MAVLRTSYWGNRHLAGRIDVVPVGISRGTPKFPVPYRYRMCRLLAPSRDTFALESDEEFNHAYIAGLEAIGVERIRRALDAISGEEGGRVLCLLCWEPLTGPKAAPCHRRTFGLWWFDQTGECVPELAADSATLPLPLPRRQLQERLF